MRWFRIRLVVLGVLLCVVHVWSAGTCGTEFTDPASSAILADIVLEGKVKSPPIRPGLYNATIQVRNILKGVDRLKAGKNTKRISVGNFGNAVDKKACVAVVEKSKKYLFYLRTSNSSEKYLHISALPVQAKKRTNRVVRKALTKKGAKAPVIKKIKNKVVKVGKTILLRCSARAKPKPTFVWFKDGVKVEKKKGLRIKNGRRGSRLQVKKAKESDAGEYMCLAKNAVDQANVTLTVRVNPGSSTYIKCKQQTYCLNGGTCRHIAELRKNYCECPRKWEGRRCEIMDIFSIVPKYTRQAKLLHDRTIIIIGIVIAILVFIAICIVSYFLAKRQRKKLEAKKLRKSKNIPETYKRLLDDVDGRHVQGRPIEPPVISMETQMENFPGPINMHPNIDPKSTRNTSEVRTDNCFRDQAFPVMSSFSPNGGDRQSRASSRSSRTRLKALSLDGCHDEQRWSDAGMDEPDCIPMKELKRSPGDAEKVAKTNPPETMQNYDFSEPDLEEMQSLHAGGPVVVNVEPPTSSSLSSFKGENKASPEDQHSDTPSDPLPNQDVYLQTPDGMSLDLDTESEEEGPKTGFLPSLHISEEDICLSAAESSEGIDKVRDPVRIGDPSLSLNNSVGNEERTDNRLPNGSCENENLNDFNVPHSEGSVSSSYSSSVDSGGALMDNNSGASPYILNGMEGNLSWDEHGTPVSPTYAFTPNMNTDPRLLEDQYMHHGSPHELQLSPTKHSEVYNRLLKDIREDQDAIPI